MKLCSVRNINHEQVYNIVFNVIIFLHLNAIIVALHLYILSYFW